eukprot:scaffold14498_cov120-Amphora_coffeaeformis.AAC.2
MDGWMDGSVWACDGGGWGVVPPFTGSEKRRTRIDRSIDDAREQQKAHTIHFLFLLARTYAPESLFLLSCRSLSLSLEHERLPTTK